MDQAGRNDGGRNDADKEKQLFELWDVAKTIKRRTEMGVDCGSEAMEVINSASEYLQGGHSSRLAYWDSKVMTFGQMAFNNSFTISTASLDVFDPEMFARNLLSAVSCDFMNEEETLQWHNLESIASRSIKYVPNVTYLLGSLEEGQSNERKPCRQQRKRVTNEPYKNPRGLERQEKMEIDMEERMKHISQLLLREYKRTAKPVEFFPFILDPDSYGRTVQNIFHVSHLIREGLFDIIPGDEKKPPCLIPTSKKRGSPAKERRLWHMALPFSMDQWECLRDTIHIKKSWIQYETTQK